MSKTSGYEHSDVTGRLLASLAIGVAAFILGTPYVLSALYRDAATVVPTRPPPAQTRAPALQTNAVTDLAKFRSNEAAALASYGWIDREHGIVRVPIARAMELTAQRGLPGWSKP
jgi:hypothetical protein